MFPNNQSDSNTYTNTQNTRNPSQIKPINVTSSVAFGNTQLNQPNQQIVSPFGIQSQSMKKETTKVNTTTIPSQQDKINVINPFNPNTQQSQVENQTQKTKQKTNLINVTNIPSQQDKTNVIILYYSKIPSIYSLY